MAAKDKCGPISAGEARELWSAYHEAATGGRPKRALMSIPADPRRDADLRLLAFIDQAERLRKAAHRLGGTFDRWVTKLHPHQAEALRSLLAEAGAEPTDA